MCGVLQKQHLYFWNMLFCSSVSESADVVVSEENENHVLEHRRTHSWLSSYILLPTF